MRRLAGLVAVVTGGAGGIGSAIASAMVAEGAHVVVADVDDATGRDVAAGLGKAGVFVHLDVRSEADWRACINDVAASHGHLDVLVNNAGVFRFTPLLGAGTSAAEYMDIVAVNQIGTFLGIKAAAPAMRDGRGGSIINVSSVAGIEGAENASAYAASKWAVRGLARCAARELAAAGIRVNTIVPGVVRTSLVERGRAESARLGLDTIKVRPPVPMGRAADPAEVADVAVFLASEGSRYINGAEIVVDGGMSA